MLVRRWCWCGLMGASAGWACAEDVSPNPSCAHANRCVWVCAVHLPGIGRQRRGSINSVKALFGGAAGASGRRVAQHTLWLAAITGVQFAGGLAQVAFSARILGADGLGVLTIFTAVTLVIYRFLSMPGYEAITTYVTRSIAAGRTDEAAATLRFTLAAALGLGAVAYVALAAFTVSIGGLLGIGAEHQGALLVYGVTGLFLALQMESMAMLRLTDSLRLGLGAMALGTLTQVCALAVVWVQGGGLLAVCAAIVAGMAVTGTAMLIAGLYAVRRAGVLQHMRLLPLRPPPDVLRFQLLSFLMSKAEALSETVDVLVLGAVASAGQVGLYRGAISIITATRLPVRPISQGVQVEYSRRWYASEGGSRLGGMALRFTLIPLGIGAVIYGLLAVFHAPVIALVLGDEFAEASGLLLILIPGAFVWMGICALRVLPAAMGNAMPALIWTSAGLAAMGVGLFWLTPEHMAEGAAWARTMYFVVLALAAMPFVASAMRRRSAADGG